MTQVKRVPINEMEMPKAVILRLVKNAVDGKSFQKEAKVALTKAVTVFISYLTTYALEESGDFNNPKNITTLMIKSALAKIGLEEYEEQIYTKMQQHLAYNREKARKKMENATAAESQNMSEGLEDEEDMEDDADIDVELSSDLKMSIDSINGNKNITADSANNSATVHANYNDDNHHPNLHFDRNGERTSESEAELEAETESESELESETESEA